MAEVNYKALADLRTQLRRFLRRGEDASIAVGLQPQQYPVLLIIKGLEAEGVETSITFIADRLHLRHHSVVGLIDRLEKKGLVTRRREGLNQRNVTIQLTEAGESLIAALASFHQETLHSLGPDLVAALQALMAQAPEDEARPK